MRGGFSIRGCGGMGSEDRGFELSRAARPTQTRDRSRASGILCRGKGGDMSSSRAFGWAVAVLAGLALPAPTLADDARDASVRARRIHARLIGVDSHIDTLQRVLNEQLDVSRRQPTGHLDLPPPKEAGMGAPCFPLWVATV